MNYKKENKKSKNNKNKKNSNNNNILTILNFNKTSVQKENLILFLSVLLDIRGVQKEISQTM